MNKKLLDFCAGRGMDVLGSRARGVVNGYEVSVNELNVNQASNSGEYPYQFHFNFYATDDQKRDIRNALDNAQIKRCNRIFTEYGLKITLTDFTVGKLVERLPEIFDTVISAISSNGGLGSNYCPKCGKEFTDNKCEISIDGFNISIDRECRDSINAEIEAENKAFEEAPNNYLRGFAGAAVGGVVGVVVAIIINLMGYYAAIGSIASIVVGTLLYQKFGGKPTKMMILIVVGTTFVFMMLSVVILYYVYAAIAVAETGVDMSAMEAFKIIMQDEEIRGDFYVDIIMTVVFTIIGVVADFAYMSRSTKRKSNV